MQLGQLLLGDRGLGINGQAVDGYLALRRWFQLVDTAQQRTLARAAGTDDRDHLAGGHLEVDVVQNLDCAKALSYSFKTQYGLGIKRHYLALRICFGEDFVHIVLTPVEVSIWHLELR